MYVLIDNLLWIVHEKNNDLKKLTDNLLSKLYTRVYNWDCSENTYRNIYNAIQDSENLKELNDILTYEIWFKILIDNQLQQWQTLED
jgi:hypothetical protein